MEAEQAIREKLIQLLARRDYSARELISRLASKFDPELVDQVLLFCEDQVQLHLQDHLAVHLQDLHIQAEIR